jgi:hypothetical protein
MGNILNKEWGAESVDWSENGNEDEEVSYK